MFFTWVFNTVAWLIVAVGIYSFGALVSGWWAGCRLIALRLIGLIFYRDERRWHAAVSMAGLASSPMGPIMTPIVPFKRFRWRLLYLGGPVTNLVAAAIALPFTFMVERPSAALDHIIFFIAANVITFVVTLVPIGSGFDNDGWLLRATGRGVCRGEELYRCLVVLGKLSSGVRPRDIDPTLLAPPIQPCGCPASRFRRMLAARRLDDLGQHDQASMVWQQVRDAGPSEIFLGQALGAILYNHLVYGVDTVPVPDRTDPALKEFREATSPNALMLKAAVALVQDGNASAALVALKRAEQNLSVLYFAGEIASTRDEINRLRGKCASVSHLR